MTYFPRKIAGLAEAQNWRCAYCGFRCDGMPGSWYEPTRDHVQPIVAGGPRIWENEVMACRLCNTGRGSMGARKYLAKVAEVGRWRAFRWACKGRKQRELTRHKKQHQQARRDHIADLGKMVAPAQQIGR